MFVFACRDCSFLSVIGDFFTEMELIHAEDMANTETAIQKAKTKRNTYVQTWRRCKRFEKRQAVFVQEYVEAKYQAINDEVMEFYNSLNVLYPGKYDLRKTKEFRKWKKAISGQSTKKSSSSSTKKSSEANQDSQDNSGSAATSQDSHDNSGPEANQDSQDNSGPAATVEVLPLLPAQITDQNLSEIHNSGPAATVEVLPPLLPAQITDQNLSEIHNSGPAATVEVLPPLLPAQITDQNLSEILEELRTDPDLNTFLNEIEIQDDDVFW